MIGSIIIGALIAGVIIHNKTSHNELTIEDEMKHEHIKKYCKDYINNILNNREECDKYMSYWIENEAQIKREHLVKHFDQWLVDLAISSYINKYKYE